MRHDGSAGALVNLTSDLGDSQRPLEGRGTALLGWWRGDACQPRPVASGLAYRVCFYQFRHLEMRRDAVPETMPERSRLSP